MQLNGLKDSNIQYTWQFNLSVYSLWASHTTSAVRDTCKSCPSKDFNIHKIFTILDVNSQAHISSHILYIDKLLSNPMLNVHFEHMHEKEPSLFTNIHTLCKLFTKAHNSRCSYLPGDLTQPWNANHLSLTPRLTRICISILHFFWIFTYCIGKCLVCINSDSSFFGQYLSSVKHLSTKPFIWRVSCMCVLEFFFMCLIKEEKLVWNCL